MNNKVLGWKHNADRFMLKNCSRLRKSFELTHVHADGWLCGQLWCAKRCTSFTLQINHNIENNVTWDKTKQSSLLIVMFAIDGFVVRNSIVIIRHKLIENKNCQRTNKQTTNQPTISISYFSLLNFNELPINIGISIGNQWFLSSNGMRCFFIQLYERNWAKNTPIKSNVACGWNRNCLIDNSAAIRMKYGWDSVIRK